MTQSRKQALLELADILAEKSGDVLDRVFGTLDGGFFLNDLCGFLCGSGNGLGRCLLRGSLLSGFLSCLVFGSHGVLLLRTGFFSAGTFAFAHTGCGLGGGCRPFGLSLIVNAIALGLIGFVLAFTFALFNLVTPIEPSVHGV